MHCNNTVLSTMFTVPSMQRGTGGAIGGLLLETGLYVAATKQQQEA